MENPTTYQNYFICLLKFLSIPIIILFYPILKQLHLIELFFMKVHNIYAFISQVLFFTSCAMVFNEIPAQTLNPHDKYVVMALKTILFYSVFTYFVAKSRDIYQTNNQRTPTWNYLEGLCRIALEWAKAIIVILCLRDQGIYFKPSPIYGVITASFYICSERIYVDISKSLFQYIEFEMFDNLEHLYVPLILNTYITGVSLLLETYFLITMEYKTLTFICLYFLVYIRLKDIYYNYWSILNLEKETFNSFRSASPEELDNFDDVCAVCLNPMSKAKITPCNHYFHPTCLKQCLKSSFLCPICKTIFVK